VNKNTKKIGSLMASACVLVATLCILPGTAKADTAVTAKGKDAVAAGRDVNIGKNTTIKEYDLDKARKIEASRFAGEMQRDCRKYVDRVHTMQLDKRPGEPSAGDQPFIFSPIYQSPDTRRMFGDEIYKELNTQQEHLKKLSGEIINMRLMHQTAPARQMMAKMGRNLTLPGVSGPEPTESGFQATKKELEALTGEHCEYLKRLM